MRRWFTIALLALLPFQFTWAAASSYCGHERDVQAQHFGHHEHQQHDGAKVDQGGGDAADKAISGNDLDCVHCHGICSGMLAPVDGLMPLTVASDPVMLDECFLRTLTHSPPERPQWAPLA
jgi:hypothetical protein